MTYKIIGDAKAEWEDENPFIFTISETSGSIGEQLNSTISIDYSELRQGFSDEFILHLKDHLIQRRTKVVINSINGESRNLRRLFRKVIDLKLFTEKTSVIDESFLLALDATIESFTYNDLRFVCAICYTQNLVFYSFLVIIICYLCALNRYKKFASIYHKIDSFSKL